MRALTSSRASTRSTAQRRARNTSRSDRQCMRARSASSGRSARRRPVRVDLQRAYFAARRIWRCGRLSSSGRSDLVRPLRGLDGLTSSATASFPRRLSRSRPQRGTRDGIGHCATERASPQAPLPFPDIEGYKVLKAATERSLSSTAASSSTSRSSRLALSEQTAQELGLESGDTLRSLWEKYLLSTPTGLHSLPLPRQAEACATSADRHRLEGELCDKILEDEVHQPLPARADLVLLARGGNARPDDQRDQHALPERRGTQADVIRWRTWRSTPCGR